MSKNNLNYEIFVPSFLNNDIDIKIINQQIDKMMEACPECENDYFLVDLLGDELNIKAFNKIEVDKSCKKYNFTPREFCMEQMRQQNKI